MRNQIPRTQHAEIAYSLGSRHQRILDLIVQRPHLLNPYPSLLTRLARRSRRFRRKQLVELSAAALPLAVAGRRPDVDPARAVP